MFTTLRVISTHTECLSCTLAQTANTTCIQCAVFLTLSLPPKHCHTTDIAQVTSLPQRGNSNFTAQYFKSNRFAGFCKQVCWLFSSVNTFYPCVIIKESLPYIKLSYLSLFRPFVILRVLGKFDGTGIVDVQYRCSFFFFLAKSDNSSDSKCFNKNNFLASSFAAMISASVVESAVFFCT
jgi:hypothetical protein